MLEQRILEKRHIAPTVPQTIGKICKQKERERQNFVGLVFEDVTKIRI